MTHHLMLLVPQRPLPPPMLPTALGETVRGLVIVEVVVIVICTAFVIDRYRRQTPAPVHGLVWASTAMAFGLAAAVVANLLTIPPTAGIYFTLIGCTAAAGCAIWAVVRTRRDR